MLTKNQSKAHQMDKFDFSSFFPGVKVFLCMIVGPFFGAWLQKKQFTSWADRIIFYAFGVVISYVGSPMAIKYLPFDHDDMAPIAFLLGTLGGSVALAAWRGFQRSNWWSLVTSRYGSAAPVTEMEGNDDGRNDGC